MSATQLSDLLPIPSGVSQPNAYQVFGLAAGESDNEKVIMAIKYAYAHLKQTQASADSEVWKRAARIAEQAKKTLQDPQLRSRLDRQIEANQASSDDASTASTDPLAGMLPSSNPLVGPAKDNPLIASPKSNDAASVLGVAPASTPRLGTPPTAAAVLGLPPQAATPAPTTAAAQPSSTAPPVAVDSTSTPSAPAIGWTPPKPTRKRRKKHSGMLVFGVLVVGMLSAIAYLLHFLNENGKITFGETQVASTTVADPATNSQQTTPSNPANKNLANQGDGVMGGAASSGVAPALQKPRPGSPSGLGDVAPDPDAIQNAIDAQFAGSAIEPSPPGGGMMEGSTPPAPNMAAPTVPEPAMPEPAMPEPSMADPNMAAPGGSPSPAVVQANQEQIAAAEKLIRDAKWDQMKPATDALLKLDLNPDQFKHASALYDIADLVNYYRGGIVRGLGTLKVGNTFEIVKDLPVIIVEVSSQSLSFRYNRVDKSFTIDEMPPTLVERIAAMSLTPDQPDVVAGLALYRLVHPATNDEYRRDAIEQLQSVDGQLDKVDTEAMLAVVKEWSGK